MDDETRSAPSESAWLLAAPSLGGEDGARLHVTLGGRYVSLLRVRGQVYAIDSICYHAGGPLGAGDIEEIVVDSTRRVPCVRCPWHHYLLSLVDGEKWYSALERDADGKLVPAGWKSSDCTLQRVHQVQERRDGIYVRVSPGDARSDKYAFRADCAAGLGGAGGRRGTRRGLRIGGDGRLPSGRIFSRQAPSSSS
mmetsp:Transcript_7329/g.22575  ORF Transcript_7329/g.22575 Transcript_7329/m.22575 type:complete len:195 (+) Transcript_7329:44-628(+)